MKVNAAVVRQAGGPFSIESIDIADPTGDEILVKIEATGICHTDLLIRDQLYETPLPMVLGHEGAGVVTKVGPDVKSIKAGDKVVLTFGYCGECPSCDKGEISYCWDHMPANFSGHRQNLQDARVWDRPAPLSETANGHTAQVNGAFFQQSSLAEYAIATEGNAVVVDDDAPLSTLAPMGCGFQTGAGAILNTLKLKPNQPVAIMGAGAVGLAAVMAAKVAGCAPIIVVDVRDDRLHLAESLGAHVTINGTRFSILEAVKEIEPQGVAASIETTGNPQVFRAAVDILRPRGVCGLIAGAKMGTEVSFDMIHILFGRTVMGILQGDSVPKTFIGELVDLYKKGDFPIDKLIQTFPLSAVNEAVAAMESGDVIKPVILMN